MFKRYWIFACLFGLAVCALSGEQARSQDQETDSRAESAYESDQPAEELAVPVRIIESERQIQARESAEQYSRDLSERDLAAQEGMIKATKSIKNATWWMLWSGVASTAFVAVGTGLLFWTLRLTRMANQAAREAVTVTREIGTAQTKAYVTANARPIHMHPSVNWRPSMTVELQNSGVSPAREVFIECHWNLISDGTSLVKGVSKHPTYDGLVDIPGYGELKAIDTSLEDPPIPQIAIAKLKACEAHWRVEVFISFKTIYGPETLKLLLETEIEPQENGDGFTIRLKRLQTD